jgi:WD40 repeat protein
VALSGDDSRSGFPSSAVVLWDCQTDAPFKVWVLPRRVEQLIFRSHCLVAVAHDKIYFYDCCSFVETFVTTNPIPGRFCVDVRSAGPLDLVAYPSPSGDCLRLADCRDAGVVLGTIPIPFAQICLFKFDSRGELLAIVVDEGRQIQLWSVLELRLITKLKRGRWAAEVTCVAFDSLSSFLMMMTKKGALHVFAISSNGERAPEDQKGMRSKFPLDLPKGTDFRCEFDIAGYVIKGITGDGVFRQFRLDLEKGSVVAIVQQQLGA